MKTCCMRKKEGLTYTNTIKPTLYIHNSFHYQGDAQQEHYTLHEAWSRRMHNRNKKHCNTVDQDPSMQQHVMFSEFCGEFVHKKG